MTTRMMTFQKCRHAEHVEMVGLRQCRSPKLAGLKLVSPEMCDRCFCRDHDSPPEPSSGTGMHLLKCAHLGEHLDAVFDRAAHSIVTHEDSQQAVFECSHPEHGYATESKCRNCRDYLFPVVTPRMPVHMVRRLIELPPSRQSEDWWTWDNVQAAHRELIADLIHRIPTPSDYGSGRGIVVVGGGKYFVSAYVTIRVLRHLGCTLPIELWHLHGEMDDELRTVLRAWDVQCLDANEFARQRPYRFLTDHWWKGWQLKAFALRHCSFQEVLLLDSDSYPTRNPESLFDWPRYREWGAIFWPDLERNAGLIPDHAWSVFGVQKFAELPTESGQLLVNKSLCSRELDVALEYNAHADFVYHVLYGDKYTFPMAWHRLGRRYARMWPHSTFDSVAIRQFDDCGETLFIHRVHDKFRLPQTAFDATPQQFEQNKFHAQFPLEQFCFDVVTELANSGVHSPVLTTNERSDAN